MRATGRADGDIHPERVAPSVLHERQRAIAGAGWVTVDQPHGVAVFDARRVGPGHRRTGADVIVADPTTAPAAIWSADCAPIVLVTAASVIVLAHAGWRGVAAGVVDVAVRTAQGIGGDIVAAAVGPSIRACCYQFGAADLELVAAGAGTTVDAIRRWGPDGSIHLDVPAAIVEGLGRHDVVPVVDDACTGCGGEHFSHRIGGDHGRHAVVAVWQPRR